MTLTLTQSALDNYSFTGATVTGNVPVTVNKATPTVTLDPMPTGHMYGGASFSIDTYARSNPIADIKFRLVTAPPAAVDVDESGFVTINHAGSVQIQAYVDESDNYLAATSQTRTLTISRANLYIIVDNYILQYMQTYPTVFPVRYDGFINGDDPSVLTGDLEFKIQPTGDPMILDIIASGVTGLPNYTVHFVKGELKLTPQPVLYATVAPVTRPYGDDNPEFTIIYSGFTGNDNINNYKIKEPPVAYCNATRTSLPSERTIRFYDNIGRDDKYIIQTITSTLTIEKAELTVKADNKFRRDNDANPALSFSYSGFKNDEELDILEPEQRPTIKTDAHPGTLPGAIMPIYFIPPEEENPRYKFRYIGGELLILPTTIVATYGDAPFPVRVTSGVTFTMDDVELSHQGILDLKFDEDDVLWATIKNSTPSNFYVRILVSPVISIPIEVKKATLTVTAKDATCVQGTAIPPFELNYSGFKYNDNIDVIINRPYADCKANIWSPPDEYAINVVGGDAQNYDIVRVPGKLTIFTSKKLPTAFIPNGGTFNNTIWPWPESGFKVQIFNRLGTLLYTGNNGWDGKYKGNYAQPGIYYYFATSPEGTAYSGSVEVIRTK